MDKRTMRLLVLAVIAAGVGCSSEDAAGAGKCMPLTSVQCPCADGSISLQMCNASGTFETCQCGALGSAGTVNGGAGTTFETGPTGGGTAGVVAGVGAAGTAAAGFGAAGMEVAGMDAAGTGAAGSGTAGTGGPSVGGDEPVLPTTTETCPTLATGNITVKGQQVQLWVGTKQADKKGAVFFYWHGTGSMSSEASLLGSALSEIQAEGGIVASFTTSTKAGTNTANGVWYTGDFEMADIILACAVKQLNIDTRRIYTGGCSAGGLQAGAMVYGRSSYLAGAMPNSGGVVFPGTWQDANHIPSVITVHGTATNDTVGVVFEDTSLRLTAGVVAKGGMAVDCLHTKGHCQSPSDFTAGQWTFLKAHPFGVSPEPYESGLPAGFPSGCTVQ